MDIRYYDDKQEEYLCDLDNIAYFKLSKNEIFAYQDDGKVFKTDTYISALECSLPTHFIRANEDVIVNKNYIKEALAYSQDNIVIIMNDKNNSSFIVSKHYVDNIKINVVIR